MQTTEERLKIFDERTDFYVKNLQNEVKLFLSSLQVQQENY